MELKEWIEKNKNWFIYPMVVFISFYFFSKLDSNKKNKNTQVQNVSVETQIQTPIETITLSE